MKLLIFVYDLSCGGAERVTANLVNYWVEKGWDITVVTLASRDLDFYTLHPSVKRVALGLASDSNNAFIGLGKNLQRIFALRKVLREVRPDIALGMMTTANVLLAFAAWGLPALRSIGSEHTHPPRKPLGYLWETLRGHAYGLLDAVIVLTNESKDWIKRYTNVKRVLVIPNVVSWPLPVQEPRINPSVSCRSERQILLAVGRLCPEKGIDWLIEAFCNLAPKHSSWDLVILGEGFLRAKLESQVKKLGLEKRVFFPGRVGNVSEWYERVNLYVMSSRFEGFPNTLIEAMAHGLAAVSFDCDTGPRDIIRHEVDGLLVPAEDVLALSAALDRLMGNAQLRQHFAKRAVEVRAIFSIEKISGIWEDLFKDILNERMV